MFDQKKQWLFKKAIIDGEAYFVQGNNIWNFEWGKTGKQINIEDPIYKCPYTFEIYQLGKFEIYFAAGEFSNLVWGIYEQEH